MLKTICVPMFFIALAICQAAIAQGPPVRYQPARPTVSPYLNLLRRDVGPLPNYHSLVRPQIQQREFNRQQQYLQQQQQTAIQSNRRELLRFEASQVAPTGTAAGFRNYSHYYPGLSR